MLDKQKLREKQWVELYVYKMNWRKIRIVHRSAVFRNLTSAEIVDRYQQTLDTDSERMRADRIVAATAAAVTVHESCDRWKPYRVSVFLRNFHLWKRTLNNKNRRVNDPNSFCYIFVCNEMKYVHICLFTATNCQVEISPRRLMFIRRKFRHC